MVQGADYIGIARGTSIHSVRQGGRWRWRLNAPVDRSPYVVHVGEGTSPAARRETGQLLRWNLLRRPLIAVHAIAMRPDQAARFRAVVWCPVSNEFLYGATADIAALRLRTTVLFGTDSTLSADWSLWSHLRRARALGALDDGALFEAVTRSAAGVWGRPELGAIAAGQAGDVVVARKKGHDRWDAFFAVDPEDVLLVLRGGVVALADTSIDVPFPAGPSSVIRIGDREKRVAEDVPGLLARLEEYGVASNLPIARVGGESKGPRPRDRGDGSRFEADVRHHCTMARRWLHCGAARLHHGAGMAAPSCNRSRRRGRHGCIMVRGWLHPGAERLHHGAGMAAPSCSRPRRRGRHGCIMVRGWLHHGAARLHHGAGMAATWGGCDRTPGQPGNPTAQSCPHIGVVATARGAGVATPRCSRTCPTGAS